LIAPTLTISDADAVRLAKELDGFPLALATAGAYLHQVTMGFGDYHRLYKASWSKLQKMSPGLTSYEDRTLYSTWQISFDRVREQNKLSAMLLRLWAYFDSHDLWFELLRNTDADDPEWIRKLTEDEMDFHAAMRVLSDHGFVEVEMSSQEQFESRGYSIHGCVHSWTIHVLNQFWDHTMEKLSLKLVASHVPEKATAQWWVTQRRLLQHATRCTDRILNDSIANEGMEESLQNLGSLYADQGKLDQAEKMYQRALQGWEKSLGPDHASTITTVNSLGNLHIRQSKLDEAEKMFQRALQNLEITQGPDDISTLSTVNNLGNLYMHKGKLDKAEKMYQRAWQEFQKELGPDHASTLTTVNNLGLLYVNQGKLDEAEKMYQRALQMREKELGQDHTATLKTVNGLGCLYLDQGKLDEAEKMFQRALQGRRMALGPDHPSTLNTVHNLGNLYLLQGKLDEAEKMYQQALRGSEQALGQGTGSYIPALNTSYSLGLLYVKRGDKAKAREMYSKALAGYRNVFGADHKECRDAEEQLAKLNVSAEESSAEAKAISPTIPVTPQSRPDSSDEKKRELSKRRRILLKLGWK
jgi:tetratricopeptide (TPR) repeat protein